MTDFPSYRRPPVAEVACALQYTPLAEMHLAHVGRYWAAIETDFPFIEEKPPVMEPLEVPSAAQIPLELLERMSWPRTWFLQTDKRRLVQLQRDRFIYNWRKLAPDDAYPRYSVISDEFFEQWEKFRSVLQDLRLVPPVPDLCELTYVNLIPQADGWNSIPEATRLFEFTAWPDQTDFLPTPTNTGALLQFEMPESAGRLRVELGTTRWEVTGDLPVLRLVLMARGTPPGEISSYSLRSWFDVAHEWIVKGFVDLVDRRTDELWGREA